LIRFEIMQVLFYAPGRGTYLFMHMGRHLNECLDLYIEVVLDHVAAARLEV